MALIYGNGKHFIGVSHFSWSLCTVLPSVEVPRAKRATLLRTFPRMLWEYELVLGVEKGPIQCALLVMNLNLSHWKAQQYCVQKVFFSGQV